MIVTPEDLPELQGLFPELAFSTDRSRVVGEFSFRALFDGERLHLNPARNNQYPVFGGCYEIEIYLQTSDRYGLPKLYERSNRIENLAKNAGKPLADFHINGDGSCCLGIFWKHEVDAMSSLQFFTVVVFSYFAWQAYFEAFQEKAPWGEYDHVWGFEEHRVDLLLQMNSTGRNDSCPCGSGKKFKHCCHDKFSKLRRKVLR